ncbi:MAG TPA: hypothetical protein VMN79_12615 [Casimicrobiaceae bacterium]|nr:hypothetical protein [Casimicrobiaceae bacterium]
MHRYALAVAVLAAAAFSSPAALALDKVDPYICPTHTQDSGIDCFLEAVPQTYTMCRHIKGIEIIEFGLTGAQEGVNGAKTEYCIDKHKILIVRPYQAALREGARKKEIVEDLRKLYDLWLDSLAKLVPAAGETDDAYKQRVVRPYAAFNEQIEAIHTLVAVPARAPKASKATKAAKAPKAPKQQ